MFANRFPEEQAVFSFDVTSFQGEGVGGGHFGRELQ